MRSTVDVLGEAVVSEAEADEYAQRYLDLMQALAREVQNGHSAKAMSREYLENFMMPRVITENCLRRGFAPDET